MVEAALESAQKGYLPAQAVTISWYQGLGKKITESRISKETELDWLFGATAWGSFAASACLRRLDPVLFAEASVKFHQSGGYSQYFYDQQPPEYIGSPESPYSSDLKSKARNRS